MSKKSEKISEKIKEIQPKNNVANIKGDVKNDATGEQATNIETALANFLSSTYVLSLQTLGCHWNVMGANFASLHTMFEEQYKELLLASDESAERMRALGYVAPASLAEFIANSAIPDEPTPNSSKAMIKLLRKNNVALSKQAAQVLKIAQKNNDEVTADIMIGRMTAHDKAAWMLGALLAE